MRAEELDSEGVIKLAQACMKDTASVYVAINNDKDYEIRRDWLHRHLSGNCWFRVIVDADAVIDRIDHLREERKRNEIYC